MISSQTLKLNKTTDSGSSRIADSVIGRHLDWALNGTCHSTVLPTFGTVGTCPLYQPAELSFLQDNSFARNTQNAHHIIVSSDCRNDHWDLDTSVHQTYQADSTAAKKTRPGKYMLTCHGHAKFGQYILCLDPSKRHKSFLSFDTQGPVRMMNI